MSQASHRGAALALGLLLALTLAPPGWELAGDVAAAQDPPAVTAALPSYDTLGAAVWTGTSALYFSGYLGMGVFSYDPGARSVLRVPVEGYQRWLPGAFWDGSAAYLVGGSPPDTSAAPQALDAILRFDPATNAFTSMQARLPSPRASASVAWDGTHAWIFGGGTVPLNWFYGDHYASRYGSPGWYGKREDYGVLAATDEILRYDPARDEVAVMQARLPQPLVGTAAVWDGRHVVVVGGIGSGGLATAAPNRDILRYDPISDTLEATGAVLPEVPAGWLWGGSPPLAGRAWPSAHWDGFNVHVTGGFAWDPATTTGYGDPRLLRYAPSEGTVSVAPQPDAFSWGSFLGGHASGGGALHTFGGRYLYEAVQPVDRLHPLSKFANWMHGTVVRYAPNQPPVAVIAPVEPAECVGGQAAVRLDGRASWDRDGDAVRGFAWSAPGVVFDDPASLRPTGTFPLGTTRVTLTVGDGDLVASATADVRVVDTQPPWVRITRPEPNRLYVDDWLTQSTGSLQQPGPVGDAIAEALGPYGGVVALGPLTVQAEAGDACGLAGVRFEVMGGVEVMDAEAPYAFRHNPRIGLPMQVTVRPVAVDAAGNEDGGDGNAVTFEQVGTDDAGACGLVLSEALCAALPEASTQPPVVPDLEPACRQLLSRGVCDLVHGPGAS